MALMVRCTILAMDKEKRTRRERDGFLQYISQRKHWALGVVQYPGMHTMCMVGFWRELWDQFMGRPTSVAE